MTFSIYAADNEFAAATGANVNSGTGRSTFDYPPNASKDLVITTKSGDADPRLFEPGDVYDLTWGGMGGGGVLTDAVVIRSDGVDGNHGIVVFEGLDGNGQIAQIVWTPGLDLENWYWSNFSGGVAPGFYTTDQDAGYTHEYICFEQAAPIHTPRGLVPAGRLKVGDTVCTWSGVRREILWIGSRTVAGTGNAAPVRFAKGAIGNFLPVKLSPQHRVLIVSEQAELLFGAPEVLVPAMALVDGRSVRRSPRARVRYVHLLLERHDILIAAGAPCESLLPGWRTRDMLDSADRAAIRAIVGDSRYDPCRPILTRLEAELVARDRRLPERAAQLL